MLQNAASIGGWWGHPIISSSTSTTCPRVRTIFVQYLVITTTIDTNAAETTDSVKCQEFKIERALLLSYEMSCSYCLMVTVNFVCEYFALSAEFASIDVLLKRFGSFLLVDCKRISRFHFLRSASCLVSTKFGSSFQRCSRQIGLSSRTQADPSVCHLFVSKSPHHQLVPAVVIEAITKYLSSSYVNLNAGYPASVEATKTVKDAHDLVKVLLNEQGSGEVVLGSSTTQLLHTLAHAYSLIWESGDEIIISEACHEANTVPGSLERFAVRWWRVDPVTGQSDRRIAAAAVATYATCYSGALLERAW